MNGFRRTRHRAWLTSLALMLLVLVQGLGAAHRIQHGLSGHVAKAAQPADDSPAARSFGHTRGGVDCQLFDELAHADLHTTPALVLPVWHGEAPRAVRLPEPAVLAPPWRLRARGPPTRA